MQIYPAIDIKDGRAVRLRQGLAADVTDYGTPAEAAMDWKTQGATYLHVVDLDGAFEGKGRNLPSWRKSSGRRACRWNWAAASAPWRTSRRGSPWASPA